MPYEILDSLARSAFCSRGVFRPPGISLTRTVGPPGDPLTYTRPRIAPECVYIRVDPECLPLSSDLGLRDRHLNRICRDKEDVKQKQNKKTTNLTILS